MLKYMGNTLLKDELFWLTTRKKANYSKLKRRSQYSYAGKRREESHCG
jgi:hypothetical protein